MQVVSSTCGCCRVMCSSAHLAWSSVTSPAVFCTDRLPMRAADMLTAMLPPVTLRSGPLPGSGPWSSTRYLHTQQQVAQQASLFTKATYASVVTCSASADGSIDMRIAAGSCRVTHGLLPGRAHRVGRSRRAMLCVAGCGSLVADVQAGGPDAGDGALQDADGQPPRVYTLEQDLQQPAERTHASALHSTAHCNALHHTASKCMVVETPAC